VNKSANNEIITFYDVPLVCGAAPGTNDFARTSPFTSNFAAGS
jgi:hypothetical protein